jgi:hypothetical protein
MNHGKVIVGNEIRHFKERQNFVEQIFQPAGAIRDLSNQILNMYETKL